VYLHALQDPGNVGAILRSAQAFGASSVALGPGTADPFSLKAVRASMGAVFAVPLWRSGAAQIGELPGLKVGLVPGAGPALAELLALDPTPREQMPTVPASQDEPPGSEAPGITLLIGAEREGLPQDLIEQADHVAHIPIETHSLNAAMAVTVALYELRTRMARG
jgi:TrmH family RNA methyltransferase